MIRLKSAMLDQATIDWLRLILIPEIGSRRGKKLLEKFKTPNAILNASLGELAKVEGIGERLAKGIVENKNKVNLDKQLELIEKYKVSLISLDCGFYPTSLRAIFDPPLVLFVKGELLPQDYFSIAIVGTRLSTFYGRTMAEKLSNQLVQRGFTIVSGGARGIDSFAHQSALIHKGRTIAVLGCGLDITYPAENKKLFEEIRQNGALISEFPMATIPDRKNFPMRNRLISGLSLGVVVIEAPQRSGALITVSHALEQGREVFSVPGKADSFTSKGTHQLLKEGAKLVESADDIIEELEPILQDKIKELRASHIEKNEIPVCRQAGKENFLTPKLTEEERKIYNLLSSEPIHLDGLLEQSQLLVSKASSILTILELKGLVKQLPGKTFVRK